MSGTCCFPFAEFKVETDHSDGTAPPLVIWLDRRFRMKDPDTTVHHTANFVIKEDHIAWLDYNMRDGYEIVRVGWFHGRGQYRYGIKFNSDRDYILYKLFNG